MVSDRHRPLPVAPRPFEGEVVGGWIGRIAARYKLPVQVLERTHDLNFEMPGGRRWGLLERRPGETLARMSALMRMDPNDIQAIPAQPPWAGPGKTLRYCPHCVFMNELDVTAPIWRRDWLDHTLTQCPTDHSTFRTVPSVAAWAAATWINRSRLLVAMDAYCGKAPMKSGANLCR